MAEDKHIRITIGGEPFKIPLNEDKEVADDFEAYVRLYKAVAQIEGGDSTFVESLGAYERYQYGEAASTKKQ